GRCRMQGSDPRFATAGAGADAGFGPRRRIFSPAVAGLTLACRVPSEQGRRVGGPQIAKELAMRQNRNNAVAMVAVAGLAGSALADVFTLNTTTGEAPADI